jgi:hypothetical protein
MDLLATALITLAFIGIVWLVSWRLARPYPREDDAYRIAHGDSFPVYPASHVSPFSSEEQQNHVAR